MKFVPVGLINNITALVQVILNQAIVWTNDGLFYWHMYRQVSNIKGTLVGNEMVDHSDVVGATPVGAAPTMSSFST